MQNVPNEYAVRAVKDYISTLDEIGIFYGYSFRQLSCLKWAASEILSLLKKNIDIPPLIVIEKFQAEMKDFSIMNPYTSRIFKTAYEAAANIIDDLIT